MTLIEQVAAKAGWSESNRQWIDDYDEVTAGTDIFGGEQYLTHAGFFFLHLRLLHAGYVVNAGYTETLGERTWHYWVQGVEDGFVGGTSYPTIEEAVMHGFLEVSDE